jgi:DNA-binding NarL/FixJ family response regulator
MSRRAPLVKPKLVEINSATVPLEKIGRAARIVVDIRLTDKEAEVLPLLAQGMTNPEISGLLGMGVRTVNFHVANLGHKLCAGGPNVRVQIVATAFRAGLLK